MKDKIKEFWKNQAILARTEETNITIINPDGNVFSDGTGGGGTLKDIFLRKLEINAFKSYLPPNGRILDIGCGNGYATIQLASENQSTFVGLDYEKEMIVNANTILQDNFKSLSKRISFQREMS